MSTFQGLVEGYPEVAVDRFTGPCLSAQYFFLSHCHTDHMVGLETPEMVAALAALPGPRLFCSPLSAALLASWPRSQPAARYVCPLTVGEPRQLSGRLRVTPLSAAHCPGSVMLLFEAGGSTVLYTGDFRLRPRELAPMAGLHLPCGEPKPLDLLYVDTTFCVPSKRDLPERRRSTDLVVGLARDWLRRGPQHRVNVQCPARLGYEDVFRRLKEATGRPVHVDATKYCLYERVPEIASCLTKCADEACVHSCHPKACRVLGADSVDLVMSIKLSTMFFFLKQDVDGMVHQVGPRHFRVLYSYHASLREVQEVVRYLRPARVVPSAVPKGSTMERLVVLLSATSAAGDAPEPARDVRRSPAWPPLGAADGAPPALADGRAGAGRRRPQSEPDKEREPRRRPGDCARAAGPAPKRPPWRCPFDSD